MLLKEGIVTKVQKGQQSGGGCETAININKDWGYFTVY